MTTIVFPQWLCPASFSMELSANQRAFASPFRGSEQVADMLNDRWLISMTLPNTTKSERSAAVEAFINGLRGMTNTCDLWHMQRRTPLGNLRGTPVTDGALVGASQIVIWGAVGFTLRAGDMIGAGGLLLQVASDIVADGAGRGVVPLVNRVRKAIPLSEPVIWDRPTAPFRLASSAGVQHVPGYAQGATLDFSEAVA